jgi:hypothetical protein
MGQEPAGKALNCVTSLSPDEREHTPATRSRVLLSFR